LSWVDEYKKALGDIQTRTSTGSKSNSSSSSASKSEPSSSSWVNEYRNSLNKYSTIGNKTGKAFGSLAPTYASYKPTSKISSRMTVGNDKKKKDDEDTDAPVRDKIDSRLTVDNKNDKEEDKDKKWYEKGHFEDGYDFGDLTKTILGIDEDTASLKDLTINSAKRGYYNSLYGEETFKEIFGEANQKDIYKKELEKDEYQFTPGSGIASGISGSFELAGQMLRQFTNPRTVAMTTGAAGLALAAGQAGPQVALPEEVLTVPAAAGYAFKTGSALSNLEIEAGHAYNEMIEMGVKEDIAKSIALAVGSGNAALEFAQLGKLDDAYKATAKKEATESVWKLMLKELQDRGIDVFTETAQEIGQELVTTTGVQAANYLDKGEAAYSAQEVGNRLWDTAKSSLLTFGMMNVPATAKNTYSIIKDNKNVPVNQTVQNEHPIVEQKVEQEIKPEVEEVKPVVEQTKVNPPKQENITETTTGQSDGETYFTMSYEQDGKVVGTVQYGEFEGKPNVKMIEVDPEYRRQGIGTKLLQELQKKYPDIEIDFGMSTEDGSKLIDSATYSVENAEVTQKTARIEEIKQKLAEYDKGIEEFIENDMDVPEDYAADYNDLYDEMQVLEEEIRGKKPTSTFVKTDEVQTAVSEVQPVEQAVNEPLTTDATVSETENVAPALEKSNSWLDWMVAERDSLRNTLMERHQNGLYDAETERLANEFNKLNSKIESMNAQQTTVNSETTASPVDSNTTPIAENPVTTEDKAKKHFRDSVLDYNKLFDDDTPENVTKFKAVQKATEEAQNFISKGADGVKGFPEIFGRISENGALDDFENYLRLMLNVDRTTLDQRFGMENKEVFGKTTEDSQKEADRLLEEHPEFKQAAEDVYAWNNYVLDMRVKAGRITQEQADRFRELYPHYVPISRSRYGNSQDYSPLLEFMRGQNAETVDIENIDSFLGEVDSAATMHKITSSGYDFNPLIDTMVNQAFVAHWDLAMNQVTDPFAPVATDGIQSAPMGTDNVAQETHAEVEPDKVTINVEPDNEYVRAEDFDSNKLLENRKGIDKVIHDVNNAFQEYILDHGFVFEKKSKKAGNRALEAKWHANRNASASAQHFIGNGNGDVRAVTDILKEVKKSGLRTEFYSYLGHLRNMDGMSLQSRYGVANNQNFMGRENTFAKSTKAIKVLEDAHPEFKAWAEDVYKNTDYILDQFVERKMITQDDKALIKELYPHYIPMRYSSKGEASAILETLAQFTNESFSTWAMNDFGVELKNTLNTEVHSEPMNIDTFIKKLDSGESLFSFGEDGEYKTFTVYENGELKTFDIDSEMYMALKDSHNWMNMKIPVLHQVNEGFRKFCTEWNIFFSLKNGVKDPQDIMYNSQHPIETYAELTHAGEAILFEESSYRPYYEEYLANGGEPITYFDSEKQRFTAWSDPAELVKYATGLKAVEAINNRVETNPRLAEYIASRKMGKSVEESMLDAARVTTNFAAGGKFTKFLNRNGCTFLNASVQGALQHARNFAEAASDSDGKLHFDTKEAKIAAVKGTTALITRAVVTGMAAIAINDLRWKDDEDYEALPDYVKDGYYLLFKYGDGQFFRLPKGRTNATIEKGLRTVAEASFGDDNADWNSFFDVVMENIAPNSVFKDNIAAPIREVGKGETWYGEDMIPYRLKDEDTVDQFDEKTDTISIELSKKLDEKLNDITLDERLNEKLDGTKLGENLAGFRDGLSPKEINYLANSYTGVLGDLVLPYFTPKAESSSDNPIIQSLAPLKDIFTTDSVLNNRVTGDFYETLEAAEAKAATEGATMEDKFRSGLLIGYNVELSDLYEQQRNIQMDKNLSDSKKYERTREIKKEINALQEQGLKALEDYSIDGNYAEAGEKRYNYDAEDDTWWEVKPKLADGRDNWYYTEEQMFHDNLGVSYSDYWNGRLNPEDYDVKTLYDERNGKRYNFDMEKNAWFEIAPKLPNGKDNYYYYQEQQITKDLGISYEEYWNNREMYDDFYYVAGGYDKESSADDTIETARAVFGYERFADYAKDLKEIKADKDPKTGESISGTKYPKVQAYVNSLDIPDIEKKILYTMQYPNYKKYKREIIKYLDKNNDISYSSYLKILDELGYKIDSKGYVTW
jgi:GNAT superfamily N-acetyltransferase